MKQHFSKYLSAAILAVTLVSVVGCASTSQQEGTGEYIDDAVITTKVKAMLFDEIQNPATLPEIVAEVGCPELAVEIYAASTLSISSRVTPSHSPCLMCTRADRETNCDRSSCRPIGEPMASQKRRMACLKTSLPSMVG